MSRLDLSPIKILVLDDSNEMLSVIQSALRGLGIEKIRALADPTQLLTEVHRFEPDLVITDWLMQPLDGLEVIRALRGPDSPNRYVAIIMLTAYAEPKRIAAARDAGVNEILAKPISIKALHERVVATLTHPRPFIECATYFGPDRRRKQRPFPLPDRRRTATEAAPETPAPADLANLDEAQAAEMQSRIASLKAAYPATLAREVEALRGALSAVDDSAAIDRPALASIRQITHDIAGQAATFDYPLAGEIAGILNRFLHGEPKHPRWRAVVAAHIDALSLVVTCRMSGEVDGQGRGLLKSLQAAADQRGPIPTWQNFA